MYCVFCHLRTTIREGVSKYEWKYRTTASIKKNHNTDFLPPMVGSWNSKNSSLTNRTTRHDLPTAVSPKRTSLKWHTLLLMINVLFFAFLSIFTLRPNSCFFGWLSWNFVRISCYFVVILSWQTTSNDTLSM